MIPLWRMIRSIYHEESYIWVDVSIIAETPKAVLISHNNRTVWLPKAWIMETSTLSPLRGERDRVRGNETSAIRISEYHWVRKFAQ